MAVKDTSRKPYLQDNNPNIKVGIDLPIRRDDIEDGWFASSKTTIEAVKNNIINLLNTNQGERLMQPTLGLDLRSLLFEQMTTETIMSVQNKILDTFQRWLPFVEVRDIRINNEAVEDNLNQIRVNIIFNIRKDPNTIDSVSLNFDSSNSTTIQGGGTGAY
jgi:phage baseplate assembly protein W|tara:strand:- start:258 stop:740 length:483 start_codon:yes stop_codon:yes gene_type:complete